MAVRVDPSATCDDDPLPAPAVAAGTLAPGPATPTPPGPAVVVGPDDDAAAFPSTGVAVPHDSHGASSVAVSGQGLAPHGPSAGGCESHEPPAHGSTTSTGTESHGFAPHGPVGTTDGHGSGPHGPSSGGTDPHGLGPHGPS